MAAPPTRRPLPTRIAIEAPEPLLDCGRYRAKRCVGDTLCVSATVFRDGHDTLRAAIRHRAPGARRWGEAEMRRVDADRGGDRWEGHVVLDRPGRWRLTIEAWSEPFATWSQELTRRLAGGQKEIGSELIEGGDLLREAADRARGDGARQISAAAAVLTDEARPTQERSLVALAEPLAQAVAAAPDRAHPALLEREIEVEVERTRARFGAWYELFPRSWGGLAGVQRILPELAELGFDVLYLTPIHPIGHTNRKGRGGSLQAGPQDPGSPWAIGSPEGGHTAIHPGLGTIEDFDRLVAAAADHGIEIAMDFAIQCSVDHPWLREHPEWFQHRPDGTIKYAENPPKRYQDIVNVDFDCQDSRALWKALRDVVRFWADHGVRIFRVDNPHTKPLPFWEWLIERIRADYPETIFLAEAFTRAAMMKTLAKLGFSQSYTYFTWKNSRHELTEYVSELARSGMQEYYRPNFFVNTPDILTEYLQVGGPPAFAARLVLAATLAPSYGIYSGFEHFENAPAAPGSEEYLDSEKYAIRQRALDGPLLPLVGQLNAIRREHVALQHLDNITFLATENEALIAYVKQTGPSTIAVAVNIDPRFTQEGLAVVPARELGLGSSFAALDLLSGERFRWQTGANYVRLAPGGAHVLQLGRS
ncbi:MAG TPA: alpha-1,4-glucan--maltose-1-phosphate maltosyltransferase [Solirubrobacteraceae bacterium]|jgi:starch synthase (maltosyl-transferring)|nr:alpha-1,4-glucan--maltose-1-phosphate maltosyltransferase [Solirubrobacteraceae bacterium]